MTAKPRKKAPKRSPQVVFLIDVDNTLLDNDRVVQDLQEFLRLEVGVERCARYWKIFERRRAELGFADYLGALQQYREKYRQDMRLLKVSRYLIDYPFANRLFPNSLDAIQHLQRLGQVALLTDGDVVFQPHKVERAGLNDVVKDNVLIYVHKQNELRDVARRYPADHYVVIDDKLHILSAIKKSWKKRVTTVFARQGHYAHDPKIIANNPPADLTVDRIGQLPEYDLKDFLSA